MSCLARKFSLSNEGAMTLVGKMVIISSVLLMDRCPKSEASSENLMKNTFCHFNPLCKIVLSGFAHVEIQEISINSPNSIFISNEKSPNFEFIKPWDCSYTLLRNNAISLQIIPYLSSQGLRSQKFVIFDEHNEIFEKVHQNEFYQIIWIKKPQQGLQIED